MVKPIVVLINGGAGAHAAGGVEASRDAIAQAFARLGAAVDIQVVEGASLARAAAEAAAAGAAIVVAAGGDGTVSTVAHALVGRGSVLGVLPLGTLNHFAKDLGIPADLDQAAAAIIAGRALAIDAGSVNGHCFVNNSSIGLYPRLVEDRDRQRRELGRRKYLAMAIAAWRAARRMPLMRVRIDAGGRRFAPIVPFVFMGNNEYTFQVVPLGTRARLDRGRLWMYLPSCRGSSGLIRILLFALLRRAHQARHLHALAVTDATIRVRGSSVAVGLDGEILRLRPPLRYRILPRALTVLVPAPSPSARESRAGSAAA